MGRPRAQREATSTKMAVGRSVCLTRVAVSQRSSEHRLFTVSFASIAVRNWSFSLCVSEVRESLMFWRCLICVDFFFSFSLRKEISSSGDEKDGG